MSDGDDHPLAREPLTQTFELEWSNIPGWARPPLHERIQKYIDEVNPQKAIRRGPRMADHRLQAPGAAGDVRGCRITDFKLTVDRNLETRDGTHLKHRTLKEMPGACIMCGEDEVRVTVQRNPDGEIEETTLKCHECSWRVTGGPVRFDEKSRLDRPDGDFDWTS